MPLLDQFDQGLINRPGLNDADPPRTAEDPYDSLSGATGFVAIPYGPDPLLLTPAHA
jgi:hypothetical protein